MKKYESYKYSGVKWIGEIPKHWEVRKLKFVTKLYGGFPFKSEKFNQENGINVIRIGDIKNNINLNKCVKSTEQNIFQITKIKKNDTLIALSGATTGKSCFIKNELHNTYINQRIAKFNYFNSFLYYCISSKKFKKDILLGADGSAQENISNTKIENMFIPFPPLLEQKKIASFLDEKVEKIEKAISKKEKLIKFLKEQKQVIINEAVTKGIDKNVEYKDSGVEWIGEIPKHWEVRKLKYVFKLNKGLNITKENLKDKGIPCINYGEIHSKYGFEIIPEKHNLKNVNENYLYTNQEAYLKKGDFIFADTSEDIEGSGNFTYLNSEIRIFAGYHTIIAKCEDDDFVKRFIAYLFYSLNFRNQIRHKVKGVKVYSITNNILKNLFLLKPPLSEQQKIVSYIEEKISKIDNLIQLQEKQIEKLKEYKITLIDEVVTGKIKVCDE